MGRLWKEDGSTKFKIFTWVSAKWKRKPLVSVVCESALKENTQLSTRVICFDERKTSPSQLLRGGLSAACSYELLAPVLSSDELLIHGSIV